MQRPFLGPLKFDYRLLCIPGTKFYRAFRPFLLSACVVGIAIHHYNHVYRVYFPLKLPFEI